MSKNKSQIFTIIAVITCFFASVFWVSAQSTGSFPFVEVPCEADDDECLEDYFGSLYIGECHGGDAEVCFQNTPTRNPKLDQICTRYKNKTIALPNLDSLCNYYEAQDVPIPTPRPSVSVPPVSPGGQICREDGQVDDPSRYALTLNGTKKYLAPLAKINKWNISDEYGVDRTQNEGKPRYHEGIDIANDINTPDMNTPILAANTGKVIFAKQDEFYGNAVILQHVFTDNTVHYTIYAHLNEIDVRLNEYAKIGQMIGKMGATGNSTGVHLHFEMRKTWPLHGEGESATINWTVWDGRNICILQGDCPNNLNPNDFIRQGDGYIYDIGLFRSEGSARPQMICEPAPTGTPTPQVSVPIDNMTPKGAFGTVKTQLDSYCERFADQPICKSKQATIELALKIIANEHGSKGVLDGWPARWLENGGSCFANGDNSLARQCTSSSTPECQCALDAERLRTRKYGRGLPQYDDFTLDLRSLGIEVRDCKNVDTGEIGDCDALTAKGGGVISQLPTNTITDLNIVFYYINSKTRTNFLNGWCSYHHESKITTGDRVVNFCCTHDFADTTNNFVADSCADASSKQCNQAQMCGLMLYNGAVVNEEYHICNILISDEICQRLGTTSLAGYYALSWFDVNNQLSVLE